MFTQELRLDWDVNDRLNFMLGAYYYESELEFRQDTNNVLQLPPVAIDPGLAGLDCATIAAILVPVGGANVRANPGLGDVLCQFPNARIAL